MKSRMKHFAGLFCLILCMSHFPMKASHMAGSDIAFQCLGVDSYRVIVRMYRDCNGIPVNPTPQISITPVAPCGQPSKTVTLTRTLIRPVKFTCANIRSVCEGGSFPFGIEENRYEATVSFNTLWAGGLDPTCCWLRIAYQECCRNGSVTNIMGGNYYIEAELNRCITPCNSSPQTLNEPISVVCSGQPFLFNNGIVDTLDHDSLSYELTEPLNGNNNPDSFLSGFNKNRPFHFLGFPNENLPFPAGFHLNTQTGDLSFTPSNNQQPVLAIKATEWRKINGTYQKIGVTRRDAQFFVATCTPNNQPEITVNGNTNGPWLFSTCAGENICLNIRATDRDTSLSKPDSTVLSWDRGITGGTFTNVNSTGFQIQHDSAAFCWTPQTKHISSLPHYFTVKAHDNNCVVKGFTTRSVGVIVNGLSAYQAHATYMNNLTYLLSLQQLGANGYKATGVEWAICKGSTFNSSNAVIVTGDSVSHTFDTISTYVIRIKLTAHNCTSYMFDTIHVTGGANSVWKFNEITGYTIYPNPAKDAFTVELTKPDQYTLMLTDYTGRTVKQFTFEGNATTVTTEGLSKGVYLVMIHSAQSGTLRSKVVME